jgi:xylulokinase
MSFLGIDLGTTGLKVAAYAADGRTLGLAYREYDIQSHRPGWATLDSAAVFAHARSAIRETIAATRDDPVSALAVSSLAEAVVPVTLDRRILGPSILGFDRRGEEYLAALGSRISNDELHGLNGNTLGNHYGLTKILWLRDHEPEMWERAGCLLPWSAFVAFMLGAEPHVDYSLANRLLLFDLRTGGWSDRLLDAAGMDAARLPPPVPPGSVVGKIAAGVAEELGLPADARIVAGAHDQCAASVGCGSLAPGSAMYGMGTYLCAVPVYEARTALAPEPGRRAAMIAQGLNVEHHAAPGRFVSFLYNQGSALVRWHRDTLGAAHKPGAYEELFAELPAGPTRLEVLPHFTVTGPPEFIPDSSGVIAGLRLDTSRGEILKGILEGATFYIRACVDALPSAGVRITDFRVTGGGAKSDAWVQLSADILGRPFHRPEVTEAGTLGAAILAAMGTGAFTSLEEGCQAMVKPGRTFTPDNSAHAAYGPRYELYLEMGKAFRDYLRRVRGPE